MKFVFLLVIPLLCCASITLHPQNLSAYYSCEDTMDPISDFRVFAPILYNSSKPVNKDLLTERFESFVFSLKREQLLDLIARVFLDSHFSYALGITNLVHQDGSPVYTSTNSFQSLEKSIPFVRKQLGRTKNRVKIYTRKSTIDQYLLRVPKATGNVLVDDYYALKKYSYWGRDLVGRALGYKGDDPTRKLDYDIDLKMAAFEGMRIRFYQALLVPLSKVLSFYAYKAIDNPRYRGRTTQNGHPNWAYIIFLRRHLVHLLSMAEEHIALLGRLEDEELLWGEFDFSIDEFSAGRWITLGSPGVHSFEY